MSWPNCTTNWSLPIAPWRLRTQAARNAADVAMKTTAEGLAWREASVALSAASAAEHNARAELTGAALAEYVEEREKHPHPQVSIRVNLKPAYQYDKALDWALSDRGTAVGDFISPVRLDTKKLENYARAVREVAPLEFVKWEEVPSVVISLDEGD